MTGRSPRRRNGSAVIELVVVTPVLLLLMLALFDLGNLLQQKIWLDQAVRAGGITALGQPENQSTIKAAVVAASWSGVTATATAACINSSTFATDSACSSGPPLYIYETITASAKFSALILPITSISSTFIVQVH
jgi:Flp pilus assembly protein TadG